MRGFLALIAGVAAGLMTTGAQAAPLRVMSLDQCADQYALALVPDAALALSTRADDPDSWMRAAARGRPTIRPTLEAATGFRPDVVVRYWGGDGRLLSALDRQGVRVLTIEDATDMDGVRANLEVIAKGLNANARGQALLFQMNRRLAEARAPGPPDRTALYLTAGGFTAGSGTLIDAILKAAGFANLAQSAGYAPVSVERIALKPPRRFVLGFFDQIRSDWRGPGRHPVIRKAAHDRTIARLPAAALSCPAWFAADAAAMLAESSR